MTAPNLARPEGANSEHERWMVCTRCHEKVLVCCYVADLDEKTFVGRACGCGPTWENPRRRYAALEATIAVARQAQKVSAG